MSRKIIFLDVDGVLNSIEFFKRLKDTGSWGLTEVDPDCVRRLKDVISATGAEIILSSTWRLVPELVKVLKENTGLELKGRTPSINQKHRGAEIESWLGDTDNVANFIVLDDDEDAGIGKVYDLASRFIHTDVNVGFTEENARAAIALLNG